MTYGFKEGPSTLDIRKATDEELSQVIREVYVRRPTSRSSNTSEDTSTPPSQHQQQQVESASAGPYGHKHFRMIDASACDLRDPIDRNRKDSITSITSIIMNEQYRQQQQKSGGGAGTRSRHSSITSTSTLRSNKLVAAGGSYAIETSFCGAKPIVNPSSTFDLSQHGMTAAQDEENNKRQPSNRSEESLTGSEDLSETRNLVEEINMRTKQLPLTKQDSYANAIYNSATRAQQARKGLKKQSSYEAAVESGAKNAAAAKRTKQIMQIRKQDSYTRAIGGSFEDDHENRTPAQPPANKMRKQVSEQTILVEQAAEKVGQLGDFHILLFSTF